MKLINKNNYNKKNSKTWKQYKLPTERVGFWYTMYMRGDKKLCGVFSYFKHLMMKRKIYCHKVLCPLCNCYTDECRLCYSISKCNFI